MAAAVVVTFYRQFSPLKFQEGHIRHFYSSNFATEVPRGVAGTFVTFYRQFSPLKSYAGHIHHFLSSIFATAVPRGSYSSLFIVNFRHSSPTRVIFVTFYRQFSPLKFQEGHTLFVAFYRRFSPLESIFVTCYSQFSPLKSQEGCIRHPLYRQFSPQVPRGLDDDFYCHFFAV